jgi:sulfotransferase
MSRRVVFLAGLPRSGSTLLCNLLGMHPEIKATPTSPLCRMVETLRRTWSEEESLLAQLDSDFDGVYERLGRAARAFIKAWSDDPGTRLTVDKSRAWLFAVEMVRELYPDFQMIVCLRDLRDVYASIERQHRRTLLLTFPDRTEQSLVDARASQLFSSMGVIGGPLRALYNLGDLPGVERNLYFWRFEDFLKDGPSSLDRLFGWLGLEPMDWQPGEILQTTVPEADSFYRFKYPHNVGQSVRVPAGFRDEEFSTRILAAIVTRFAWYYRQFYRADGRVDLSSAGPESSLRVEDGLFGVEE